MMRFWPAVPLLLLGACATLPQDAASGPTADWLAGTWLVIENDAERDLVACASGLPIAYRVGGTYSMWEEEGTWRLEGGRLTEIATQVNDGTDPAEVAIGRPFVSRIERVGPNEMRKYPAASNAMTLLRCPDAAK